MDTRGVPFILRKKFYPLPPFEFRNIQPTPNDIESYEYDFSFERETVSSSETYHEEKDKREQLLADRRARLEEQRKRAEEERKRLEEERKKLEDERQRQAQEEEEERLALTFSASLAPSQSSFIPHLPQPPTWTPTYYDHHHPPTGSPLIHPTPLPWRDPTSSHSTSPAASVASTPSFISTQFPFLSRFARTNRYDN